jgi:hypothetical protein
VLYKGKEIRGAVVTFHLKDADPVMAVRPVGLTTSDGTFTLTTGQKPGAAAGEYAVTFIWPKEVPAKKNKQGLAMEMGMGTDTYDALDGAYADASRSAFKVEIKAGETKLEAFRLD